MNKENGFTLFETVITIIILAVIAIIAAPKFIGLKTDSHQAKLYQMQNAINSANVMIYAKAVTQGKSHHSEAVVELTDNITTEITFGYAQATQTALESALHIEFDKHNDIDGNNDWIIEEHQSGAGFVPSIDIWLRNSPKETITDTQYFACKLTYKPASVFSPTPSVNIHRNGC